MQNAQIRPARMLATHAAAATAAAGGLRRQWHGKPAWCACREAPGTMVKWCSSVGLLMVEWHILYTPVEPRVTDILYTPVEPRVTVTEPEATTPPCDESAPRLFRE